MGLEIFQSGEWSRSTSMIALLAAPFLLLWFLFLRYRDAPKQPRLPPGPPALPLLGHLRIFADNTRPIHHTIDDLHKIYGPVIFLKMGVMKMVYVNDTALAMEITKAQDHLFAYRPPLLAGKYLLYGDSHICKYYCPLVFNY
jgi:hypothetical protein